ncbi:Crp/Fnr family transcriptional regulator [Aquimarina algiphila]|uniref:Crp/Fnr family transcriptional regulator n=1 Tax=Aquimarina algiphila TaxID=2047982 RepID=UPI002491265A|nr:Crp/Fnr family transcriptional regulator [Aquimarina algiphila]
MNNSLLKFLNNTGAYSEKEVALLKEELQFRTLKKDEILLKKGDVCSSFCFIITGSFYQYNIDANLDKNIIDLNVADDWVINHKSFTSRKPSQFFIQAFENSSVYEISIDAIHKLIAKSQSFLQMGKILEEATSRVDLFDNDYTPDEKYQYILKNKPELIQRFPQKLIASYLKITPETLSRVRKRFLKP